MRYAADLVVPRETRLEIAVLKGIAARYVMRADDRVALMGSSSAALLAELVGLLADRGPRRAGPALRRRLGRRADDAARLRVVVDQVASLTDASAVAQHPA